MVFFAGCAVPVVTEINDSIHNAVDTRIWAGANQSFYLDADNILWSWGENTDGSLGDGTVISRYKPEVVLSDVSDMGDRVALRNDGSLWVWGLGTGTPYWVTDNVSELCLGGLPFLKEDHTLWNLAWVESGRLEAYMVCEDVLNAREFCPGTFAVLKHDGSLWGYGTRDYYSFVSSFPSSDDQELPICLGVEVSKVCADSHGMFYIDNDSRLWASGGIRDYFGDHILLNRPIVIKDNMKDTKMGMALDTENNLYILRFIEDNEDTHQSYRLS